MSINYLRISNLHDLYKPTFSPKVFTPAQKRSSQTHPNPSLSPKKTRRRGQVLHWNDLHHWTHHQLHQHLGAKSHQCHSVEAAYAWAGWAGLGSVRGKCILYIYSIYIYDYIFIYPGGAEVQGVFIVSPGRITFLSFSEMSPLLSTPNVFSQVEDEEC